MKLLQRLHLALIPTIGVITVGAGAVLYHWQLDELKLLERSKWIANVEAALKATRFEIKGIEALGYEISGSTQFLRHIQDTGVLSSRNFLESHINYVLSRDHSRQESNTAIYVLDEMFTMTAASSKSNPFSARSLPDDLYQHVFDSHVKVSLREPFDLSGNIYQSLTGEVRYSSTGAYDPTLPPDDKYAITRPDRSLLVVDGSLIEINALFSEASQYPYISLEFSNGILEDKIGANILVKELGSEFIDGNIMRIAGAGLIVELNILDSHYTTIKKELALDVFGYLFLVMFVLLMVIHLIIRRRILYPIDALLSEIHKGGLELRYFKRAKGTDEVSVLKNAYIDSLSKVKFEAEFDGLTRLANRRSFIHFVEQRIASYSTKTTYIVAWDIIDFRRINDLYGAHIADQVLKNLAREIELFVSQYQESKGSVNSDYSVCRYGSNTFCVLLEASDENKVKSQIVNSEKALKRAGLLEVLPINLELAMAIFPLCRGEQSHLWQKGLEEALNKAKQIKNQRSLVLFDDQLLDDLSRIDDIERVLMTCTQTHGFELCYMPIIDSKSFEIASLEALVRCPVLQEKGIGPDEFIPVAEKANIIGDIDRWVIENALRDLQKMKRDCDYTGSISINISALELYNNEFIEQICSLCRKYGVKHHRVILEVTETSYVRSTQDTVAIISGLRELGFKVSLDDFGTGYASINQLLLYPVDELKIDKSFVDRISEQASEERMLKSIIALGHNCQAKVVGEGVETANQFRYLTEIGCDYLQGYFFSKPLGYLELCKFYKVGPYDVLSVKVTNLKIADRP
ncbi:EAL domain-containing protein [Vibrio mediterranei]|nr:EAL domain-containing protein [Vibrio mediterranei]